MENELDHGPGEELDVRSRRRGTAGRIGEVVSSTTPRLGKTKAHKRISGRGESPFRGLEIASWSTAPTFGYDLGGVGVRLVPVVLDEDDLTWWSRSKIGQLLQTMARNVKLTAMGKQISQGEGG